MRFRTFVQRRQEQAGGMRRDKPVLGEGVFRDVVNSVRSQKAEEEQQAIQQGQIVQQASARHALGQAVEKCARLVEFVRDVEEAVQTGDLSRVQSSATTMRGAATGLLQILKQLTGKQI